METKSAGVGRALGSTWTIVSPALRKQKRTVLHWISYLVLLSAIFFSTLTVSRVTPGEGQKGVVLFHMQLYFFLTLRNLPRAEARRSDCGGVTEINRIKKTRDPRQLS